MFDVEKSPQVFNLTPEIVTKYVTRYRDGLLEIVRKCEAEILGHPELPEKNRAGVQGYIASERMSIELVEDMLANVDASNSLVSRREWHLLSREFSLVDVDASVDRIRAIAFSDGDFHKPQ